MKRKKSIALWAALLFIIAITCPIFSCIHISSKGNAAFNSIEKGYKKTNVIEKFDMPYVLKMAEASFPKYEAYGCHNPCIERLWFQNRYSLDIEAWPIDIDSHGRVIDKYHWVSP